jgi:thiamine biosynthesis lipoprotein
VSSDPTLADALSTSLFVCGLEKSTELWMENSSLFDFIFYDEDGNLFITEGLENDFKSDYKVQVLKK